MFVQWPSCLKLSFTTGNEYHHACVGKLLQHSVCYYSVSLKPCKSVISLVISFATSSRLSQVFEKCRGGVSVYIGENFDLSILSKRESSCNYFVVLT